MIHAYAHTCLLTPLHKYISICRFEAMIERKTHSYTWRTRESGLAHRWFGQGWGWEVMGGGPGGGGGGGKRGGGVGRMAHTDWFEINHTAVVKNVTGHCAIHLSIWLLSLHFDCCIEWMRSWMCKNKDTNCAPTSLNSHCYRFDKFLVCWYLLFPISCGRKYLLLPSCSFPC